MTIYKDIQIRDELLSELEEFESSNYYKWPITIESAWDETFFNDSRKLVHSDNYIKLYDIINDNTNNLLYIRKKLSEIMKRLSKNHNFYKTDYGRYKHNCELYGLRLDILKCRLKDENLKTCLHDYLGMNWLPSFRCKHSSIKNLTSYRDGTPDFYGESPFGKEWEIKVMIGNIIYFTGLQLKRFKKDVNILIFKTVKYRSYVDIISNIGCEFHNHIKFGDMCDLILEKKSHLQRKKGNILIGVPVTYQIHVVDSPESARSILESRYDFHL